MSSLTHTQEEEEEEELCDLNHLCSTTAKSDAAGSIPAAAWAYLKLPTQLIQSWHGCTVHAKLT